MWAVSPILTTKPPLIPSTLTVSANSHPHPQNIGGLGHTLISALSSSPNTLNPIPKQEKQEQQKQENKKEGSELSGSDVLWALQRAAAQKNKKNKKRRESSSSGGNIQEEEDAVVDYTNVRPLRMKSEWGVKLNDLEKRLQELSETT